MHINNNQVLANHANTDIQTNDELSAPTQERLGERSGSSSRRSGDSGPLAVLSGLRPQSGHSSPDAAGEVGPRRSPAPSSMPTGKPAHVGTVSKRNGLLVAKDPVIGALLRHAGAEQVGSEINNLHIGSGTQLKMTHSPELAAQLEELTEHCKVTTPAQEGEEASAVGNVMIPLLQQVITKGSAAFGEHAHVARLLEAAAPHIVSNHAELGRVVNQKVNQSPELKLKLGADALLEMATKKELDLKGLMGSLLVSSGLGSGWELWLSHVIKDSLFGKGFSPSKLGLKLAGIDSVPPLMIETLDTLIVLSIMKTMKGEKDWSLKDLLPKAIKAGAISAVFSYPNNVLQYMSTGIKPVDTALNVLTTEAAIFSAAAGVPLEVKEGEEGMHDALLQKISEGMLAPPLPGETQEAHVQRMVDNAIAIAPGESIAQKSMGLAAVVGLVPFILGDTATKLVPESVLRIVRSTAFNPIEAIGLNFLAISAKVGVGGLMTSDHQKHAQVVKLILDRASGSDQEAGGAQAISTQELQGILAPKREFLRSVGASVIQGMNGMFQAMSYAGQALSSAASHVGIPHMRRP